jgi:general secretion pathway protein L
LLFNSSIGIDINITTHQVRMVYLKGSFKGMHLAAAAEFRPAPGQSKPGTSTPDLSKKDIQKEITDFINNFVIQNKITAADTFMGISGDQVMLREIEFPLAVKENLRTTLTYEIEKYFPLPADDVYFDFQIISEDKDAEKLRLLIAAVKKDRLEPFLKIAEQVETGVSGISILPAALANYFLKNRPAPEKPLLLFFWAEDRCEIAVTENRVLVYGKSLPVSGISVSPAVWIRQQAESLKETFCGEGVAGIAVVGLPASEWPADTVPPGFEQISQSLVVSPLSDDRLIPAYGLALEGIGNVPVAINLLPPVLRKKPDKTGFYVMLGLVLLVILAGGIWAGSHLVRQRQTLALLDAELAQLRSVASEIQEIQTETLEMQKNLEFIHSLRPGNAFATELVNEISAILPLDAWLTDFKISGNKISIYGVAGSATELISLLEASPYLAQAEFISTIRKDRDGREVFRIGCLVQNGNQEE